MHLKRLEMTGFKSFAERTRLEFEPGVTAVVGPNGCGKSNVVDAIRWCLGEMSAKSLRSKALLDVIFNGSAGRSASNLAEVSLTFDNAHRRLPLDYTEITVTRRLFRSGESEYFLNKTQCRLKDIKDLFLDTGLGEDGYSIMEQGKVDYVLHARPEERRELFEEAAGVAKYKARREEALRKMERAQIDLDRLADVIALTKEQMDKIEAAVKKARNYQKMQENLRSLEITHALWESAQLDEQILSMEQALRVIENDLAEKTTAIHQQEARLAELRLAETEQGERLVALNRRLADIDGAMNLAEQKQQTAREREEEIRHRDLVLDGEIAQGAARLAELERLRAEVAGSLEAERASAEESARQSAAVEQVHAARVAALKGLEAQAKALQDQIWRVNQDRTKLHNDIASHQSLSARLEAQESAHVKDRARLAEGIAQAEANRERLDGERVQVESEKEKWTREGESLKASLSTLQAELESLTRETTSLQNDYFRAKAQLDAQEEWESSDVYAQGVGALLTAGLPGLHGPVGKLLTVSALDENPVRRALGPHVNSLVADNLAAAQAALEYLKSTGRGRARILVLDRLPAGRPTGGELGPRSLVDAVKAAPGFEPVLRYLLGGWLTQGGDLYGDGIVEGGAEGSQAPAFDSLRRENLQREIAQTTQALEARSREREERESRRRTLAGEWETCSRRTESARLRGASLGEETDKQAHQLELLRQEAHLMDAEKDKFHAEAQRARETALSLESGLAALHSEEDTLRSLWQALQEDLQKRQTETVASSSDLAAARERAKGREERFRWQEKQAADTGQEAAAVAATLEAKRAERAGSDARVADQRRIQEETRIALDAHLVDRRRAGEELDALHGERRGLQESLAVAQKGVEELREASSSMQDQRQEKKIQHNHARFRRESIETQIKEKYALSLAEARESHPLPAQPVATAELDKLRRRVEGLGPVNLAAPEEHAQLEERTNFLLSQQQDLLKAKEDLTATIQKINATTRQNFRETFDKVRVNFKELYGRLFPGGEADIRLTDETDVLNAGIEIYAQPPGKKLLNISLLSGGEKALTAVSLLFAFFMVRPAPFAVLDEVDAPLDEANVTRWVGLIQAFTDKTQFLLITHNKRSMETADVMYGVTMEVHGVSRILSARLASRQTLPAAQSPEAVLAEPSPQPVGAP
jgi:chromosome segregation protein